MINKTVAISLLAFLFLNAKVWANSEDTLSLCDLKKVNNAPISIPNQAGYYYLNVINLDNPGENASCNWEIQGSINQKIISLSQISLASSDSFIINGSAPDENETTIYQYSGNEITQSFLFMLKYTKINIKITIDSRVKHSRVFQIIYFQNYYNVPITKDNGYLSFPINQDSKVTLANISFTLQPAPQYWTSSIMFQFVDDTNVTFEMNKIFYNGTKNKEYFLENSVEFKLLKFQNDKYKPIKIRYWLVTSDCSGRQLLNSNHSSISLTFPDENFRSSHSLVTMTCAQIFLSNDTIQKNLQLNIAENTVRMPNSGDTLSFYDLDTMKQLAVIGDSSLIYYNSIYSFFGPNIVAFYESPYADSKPNKQLQMTISLTNNTNYMLENSIKINVKKTNEVTKLIYNIYSMKNRRLVVLFDQTKIENNNMTISIYNDAYTNIKPLVVLDQFDLLPPAVAIDKNIMRLELTGIMQDFTMTVEHIDDSGCNQVSTYSSFNLTSTQNCSWIIPRDESKMHTVIEPIYLNFPKGITFELIKLDRKSSSILSINGPYKGLSMADFLLSSNNTYLLNVFNTNKPNNKDNCNILMTAKYDFFKITNTLSDEDRVTTFKSINYPGNYPVGFTFNNIFANRSGLEQALVTVKTIDLGENHLLNFIGGDYKKEFTNQDKLDRISDWITKLPLASTFNTEKGTFQTTGHGFDISLMHFVCGSTIDLTNNQKQTIEFNHTNANHNYSTCIWQITSGHEKDFFNKSILNFNVTLGSSLDTSEAELHILDSISLRDKHYSLCNNQCLNGSRTEGYYQGSIGYALIFYNYSKSLQSKDVNFSLSITVERKDCQKGSYKLQTCTLGDRCITDMMACNGKNDCGDWSDELYCHNSIVPVPGDHSGGVNIFIVLFIIIPLSALLGVIFYKYFPPMFDRFRHGRYTEFRSDLSEVS